ncbi:MAG: secretion protein HlyD [Rhodospirillales bacterium 20-64-7]|nr:MAG: secretion protein HlyD [Rhodospirillales bacterium 20-64-7]
MSQSDTVRREQPDKARDQAEKQRAGAANVRRANRSRILRPALMIGGVVVLIIGALLFWLTGGQYVSSDDTYVDAAKVSLSTDVSGLVAEVAVKDNQHVTAGQVLFSLDQTNFTIAVQRARANLAQAVLDIKAAKRAYAQSQATIAAQKVQIAQDQSTLDRYAKVVRNGGITREVYDNAKFALQADQAKLGELTAASGEQLAKLAGNADIQPEATPEYLAALAQLNSALQAQKDSVVRAPFSGYVTLTPQLQPGMYLTAGAAAFGLVSDTNIWVTAQPKESDLTWVRDGQPVKIRVDTYPGKTWNGVVESISPASGSEFSILPAQNSSGNWVKVVQRIPVRVKITSGPDLPLRDGMSAEISINTHHHRHFSDLF